MAALELFATHGYHGTSISAIARHAGISKGLVYNYFESKENILLHLEESYLDSLTQLMNPNEDDEITECEMSLFLDRYFHSLSQQKELFQLYFQLAVQPGVQQLIIKKLTDNLTYMGKMRLIYNYFSQRFEDPDSQLVIFLSFLNGFSFHFVFSPELLENAKNDKILQHLKSFLIVPKKNQLRNG